jgi:hypothetical protein
MAPLLWGQARKFSALRASRVKFSMAWLLKDQEYSFFDGD